LAGQSKTLSAWKPDTANMFIAMVAARISSS